MGEKTTIEIDKMRELKQHALDTNKTLKQIINEAIWEKITRERKDMNLPPLMDQNSTTSVSKNSGETKLHSDGNTDQNGDFDQHILNIIRSECARSGLVWDNLTTDQWNEKLEFSIQTALELVYDESVALDTIKRIKTQLRS